jgi:tetratricopeptide (TPR) repeat protein
MLEFKETNPNKALKYAFEIINKSNGTPSPLLVGVYAAIGDILSNKGLDANALNYYLKALQLFKSIPDNERIHKKIEHPPYTLISIGNIYFKQKDYEKAEEKYSEALDNFNLIKNEKTKLQGASTVYDNLGLISTLKNNFIVADSFYNLSYNYRLKQKKESDIIYSLIAKSRLAFELNDIFKANSIYNEASLIYNKASLNQNDLANSTLNRNYGYLNVLFAFHYYNVEKYETAIDYFEEALKFLQNFPLEISPINSMIAKSYLKISRLDIAEETALNNLNKNENVGLEQKIENFNVLEKVYSKKEKIKELISVKDSIIKIASIISSSNLSKSMSNLETQILLSKNENELIQNKIKYNTYLYILIIGSVILFFSLITMRVNYNFQKEKNNRLTIEQEIISKDLEHKNLELISSTNFISQRNEYLKSLRNKIKTLEKNNDSKESSELISNNIKRSIDNIINSEKSFESFEKQFTEVYPGFFKNLIKKHGRLTSTDLRLCAYLRMNQNSSEIAQITGASIRTIESQRYRLRKKLNLKPENDIINYLITI